MIGETEVIGLSFHKLYITLALWAQWVCDVRSWKFYVFVAQITVIFTARAHFIEPLERVNIQMGYKGLTIRFGRLKITRDLFHRLILNYESLKIFLSSKFS